MLAGRLRGSPRCIVFPQRKRHAGVLSTLLQQILTVVVVAAVALVCGNLSGAGEGGSSANDEAGEFDHVGCLWGCGSE